VKRSQNIDRVEVNAEAYLTGEIFEFTEKVLELFGQADKY
jgi:hypothetical protein